MPVPMRASTNVRRRIPRPRYLNFKVRHAIISSVAARQTEFSPAVEDYAKAIYALQDRCGGAVSTTALAERLGGTPASASGMVRKLGEACPGAHEPYRGVRLNSAGTRGALAV